MRDYGKISPTFWTGETGKKIRGCPEAQIVVLYLLTCPQSNMLGLFYIPEIYIAHETGLGFEGASKGLLRAIESGFLAYDKDSEVVWVYEMAFHQIGDSLKDTDLRCKGIQKEYDKLPNNMFLKGFFDKYKDNFHMSNCRVTNENKTPYEAPTKPLRSQEQEQEQKQEKEQEQDVREQVAPKFNFKKELLDLGCDKQLVDDWMQVRKDKKASNTITALNQFKNQVQKSGITFDRALTKCVEKSWKGFEAAWYENSTATQNAPAFQNYGNGSAVNQDLGAIDLKTYKTPVLCDTPNAMSDDERIKKAKELRQQLGM
jgi:hypothetical protein